MGRETRREFVKTAGGGALASLATGDRALQPGGGSRDVVVVGAGVFGTWTGYHLLEAGRRVKVLDAYGPGSSRASSGGETRVIRSAYGDDEIYTRFSFRSLEKWKDLSKRVGHPLFHETGVLWMARDEDPLALRSLEVLSRVGVPHEKVTRSELEKRYPQVNFGPVSWAIWEPRAGALMARRSVHMLALELARMGGEVVAGTALMPSGKGHLSSIATADGRSFPAADFVFACGPWLAKVFPELLGRRIFPTRQEVFYFGPPSGDDRFRPSRLPIWIDDIGQWYGLPDIESKGFKLAQHALGPAFDPDTGERSVSPEGLAAARAFVSERFPALEGAPLVAAEVCQYENSSNGDFLIDRHPDFDNVWLVGGGSGHGFKHGPVVGEYVAERVISGGPVETRFSLATKGTELKREVT
ncbi:MAG TPA: FAD-dependent oxidoreductase [Vicinamibacteria bacterium]